MILTQEIYDINYLKEHCEKIHYFGLGFVQLKFKNNTERMHFYTDKFPKTVHEEEIHNHRYNFKSHIVSGEFHQDIYVLKDETHLLEGVDYNLEEAASEYTHMLLFESCNAKPDEVDDSEQWEDDPYALCNIEQFYSKTFQENDSYFMDHHTYHTVSSNNAITFLVREPGYRTMMASIACPINKKLECPFSVDIPEDQLWDFINDRLKQR